MTNLTTVHPGLVHLGGSQLLVTGRSQRQVCEYPFLPLHLKCAHCGASLTHADADFYSTDALIVATPIPLLWKVKLTSGRKIAVGLLLCSGIFIMIATILRCVMSLHDIQGINVSTIWAIRETVSGKYRDTTQRYLVLV